MKKRMSLRQRNARKEFWQVFGLVVGFITLGIPLAIGFGLMLGAGFAN